MASQPDNIVLKRDRDLEGRRNEIWVRRGLLALVLLVPLAAVFNAFGQRPATSTGSGERATIKVYAPERLRSGDIFEARFTIKADRTLRRAVVRLDPGWLEAMSINSIEPQPETESSDDKGRPMLTLGRIEAGDVFRFFIYFQANPTNVGRRSQDVDLLDGDHVVVHLDRTVTVFP
jgi:hypothetical protein